MEENKMKEEEKKLGFRIKGKTEMRDEKDRREHMADTDTQRSLLSQ